MGVGERWRGSARVPNCACKRTKFPPSVVCTLDPMVGNTVPQKEAAPRTRCCLVE